MKHSKWLMITVLAAAFLMITGCSSDNDESKTELTNADEDVAEKVAGFEEDEGIEDMMVQLEDGEDKKYANTDIEINDDQELSGEEVAEKYGEILKEDYPDRIIDIIVSQDGEVLEQVTIGDEEEEEE